MQKYKSAGNRGLFDEQENLSKLSSKGNPLDRISKVIDFEMFRDLLESKLLNVHRKSNAGCKPYDVVMMFKIIILQRYYGLGDEQIEYQILDRMSFRHFLGLESGDKVPNEKTVWLFRENLTKTGLAEELFDLFHSCLEQKGMILNEGKMIDASFTIAPRQRNTREENEMIKAGMGDGLWNDRPHKKRHKDIDARWTKKNGETFYGYKDHIKADAKSKFIDKYTVTDASADDSQPLDDLLEEEKDRGQDLNADSAYTGKEQEKVIAKNRMNNQVHEKGYRGSTIDRRTESIQQEKIKSQG